MYYGHDDSPSITEADLQSGCPVCEVSKFRHSTAFNKISRLVCNAVVILARGEVNR